MNPHSGDSPAESDSASWSLVERARSGDATVRRAALQTLLDHSVPGLRLFLTYQLRLESAVADDLLQEFVLAKVLSGDLLQGADSQRGSFHSLLRTALRNFVLDHWRRAAADKRKADRAFSLPDEAATALTGERGKVPDLSEVAHAWQVLIETLDQLSQQCQLESRGDLWCVFEERVLKPAAFGAEPPELEQLAQRLGYSSTTQVSNALVTVQRKLNRTLREVLLQYVDQQQVDAELEELHRALAASHSWQPALAELGSTQPVDVRMSICPMPYSAAELSQSLFFSTGKDPAFGTDVLAECLRAVLELPASSLWNDDRARREPPAVNRAVPAEMTVGRLLSDRATPVSELVKLKEFAKSSVGRPDRAHPRAICTLLYFASIIAAGVHRNQQISSLGADGLMHGVNWLGKQGWLNASMRTLLAEGRTWLQSQAASS